MQAVYTGLNGKKYSPGRKIGQGGEGAVFDVTEDAEMVIKLYTDPLEQNKIDKLVYMTTLANPELLRFAAWPLDVVRDNASKTCGLIMRKLEAYVPLHNLFSPIDRKKLFPDKGYNFLIHVARNLAVAFHKIHQSGIVAGDVNEANILVNNSGMIALIDCDSFQIKKGNQYFFCEVGIPRYTPPELLSRGSFAAVVRDSNTDCFSLSVLIFQLLFLGRSPFTGTPKGPQEIDEETAIKTYEFAYSLRRPDKLLWPAKNSFKIESLSRGISHLFHEAFENRSNRRPTALQWANELGLQAKNTTQCDKAKVHYYPNTLTACPWCEYKSKSNIVYFLDDSYLKDAAELADIDQFINGYKFEELKFKTLNQDYYQLGQTAAPIDGKYKRYAIFQKSGLLSLIVITGVIFYFTGSGPVLLVGLFCLITFFILSPFKGPLTEELGKRQVHFNTLHSTFETLVQHYNKPNNMPAYKQSATKLNRAIAEYKRLPEDYQSQKRRLKKIITTSNLRSTSRSSTSCTTPSCLLELKKSKPFIMPV